MQIHSLARIALVALTATYIMFSHAAPATKSTILVMGDSLSAAYGIQTDQGWVTLLEQRLKRRGFEIRVINASIAGETTSGGLARLPAALKTHDPALVIIELGANDGLRGVDPILINRNLTRMVELSQQHGARLLLIGVRIPANYGEAFRKLYDAQYGQVAQSAGVPLVPFLLEGVAQVPGLMQADGLHPTAEAQPIILNNVWPKLKSMLKASVLRSDCRRAELAAHVQAHDDREIRSAK